MTPVEVAAVCAAQLREPLRLLESWLRNGEPTPEDFVRRLRGSMQNGDTEVLEAREGKRVVGVAVVAYRLNISAGGLFASIEDLYVASEVRRRGVGRALLEAVYERCVACGVSYLEAQVEEAVAGDFYAAFGYEQEPGMRVFSRSIALNATGDEKPKDGG